MSVSEEGYIKIMDGSERKGGINPKPSTPRPSKAPEGQRPREASGSK